jgi:hypothetical protein
MPEPRHAAFHEPELPGAVSEDEADLLLGRTRPAPLAKPGGMEPPSGSPGAMTEEESDGLLGPVLGGAVVPTGEPPEPAHPAPPAEPARSGASGAAVINELVDEIEKDHERDLDRHAPPLQARRYGRTVGCWVSPLVDASDQRPAGTQPGKREEGPS